MISAPQALSHAVELAPLVGVAFACVTLGMARTTFYRQRAPVTIYTPAPSQWNLRPRATRRWR